MLSSAFKGKQKQASKSKDVDDNIQGPSMLNQETNVTNVTSATIQEQGTKRLSHVPDDESTFRIAEAPGAISSSFSPNDMEVFQMPMCLVSTDEKKALKIETKTVEQISQITWPVVVVSVVGLYRTGKSYLLNLLADSTEGFVMGHTVELVTKGIWVWCKIHPEKKNTVLMLLDTEGLGDFSKGYPNHDYNICTLATLLCNCLVYNTRGAFDQDAVGQLTFVTEILKTIRFQGNFLNSNSNLNLVLPDFVLCLRDFTFKLETAGKLISEDEYFEESMEIQESKDKIFNKSRECIRKYFPERKCFALPMPCGYDMLDNLHNLQFSQLSERFKEASTRFVSYIYGLQPKGLLDSKPMNGQMFTTLATSYVSALREGGVPDIDLAFSAVANVENKRVEKEAFECFERQMKSKTLPVPYRVLENVYATAQRNALSYLRTNLLHGTDGLRELQLQMKMDMLWHTIKEVNTEQVQKKCADTLNQVKTSVEEQMGKDVYKVAGGYRMFQRDIDKMKEDYTCTLGDYAEHEILWTWYGYLNEMKKTEKEIIKGDDDVTRKEKKEKKNRYEETIKKMMEEKKTNQEQFVKEERKIMEEHYRQLEAERIEHFEKEKKQFQEFLEMKTGKEQAEWKFQELQRQEEKRKKKKWVGARVKDALLNK